MPYADANTRIPRRLSITSLAKALLGGITSALATATTTDVPVGYIAIVTDEGNSLQTQQMGADGTTALARGIGRASGNITITGVNTSGSAVIPVGLTNDDILLASLSQTPGGLTRSCHFHIDPAGTLTADLTIAPGGGQACVVHYFFP
jgi:hypothetical protein